MYGIQKASVLKRVSAFLLDFILMTIAATGFAVLVSLITGREKHVKKIEERKVYYETHYSETYYPDGSFKVDVDITQEDFDKLDEDKKDVVNKAKSACGNDEEFKHASSMSISLFLIMITFGILLSFILLEVVLPVIFGNGQTVGKKVFSLGVVHVNAVKLTGVGLFARSILGKYTVEVMIPLILLFMLIGGGNASGLLVLGLLVILEIFAFFKNKMNTPIHDVLAHTVCVDLSIQRIYQNEQELIDHKLRTHSEAMQDSEDY